MLKELRKLRKSLKKLFPESTAELTDYGIDSDGSETYHASIHNNKFKGGCLISGNQLTPNDVIENFKKQLEEYRKVI